VAPLQREGVATELQGALLRVQHLTQQVALIQEELDQLLITLTALQSQPPPAADEAH
jgi:hypothetical protein